MSLLMNEDFAIYQLRLGYLNNIHDGVGERLINLDASVLNNPAFRAAGWTVDAAAVKRCYSPPIPTGSSDFGNDYFQRPRRNVIGDDDEQDRPGGGMVTGHQGGDDTLGPAGILANERRRERRRRKEQMEEDDSSDLSDDSDEDEKGPAQSIKFAKMPLRQRADTTPLALSSNLQSRSQTGSEALARSTPRPLELDSRSRSGSLGVVQTIKQRARRDTTTSSEQSSENEFAPAAFKRKLPSRPGNGPSVLSMGDNIEEEDEEEAIVASELEDEDDDIDVGEASDLSDEFDDGTDSPTMLGLAITTTSDDLTKSSIRRPLRQSTVERIDLTTENNANAVLPALPRLPSGPRPPSMAQPVSMISKMLKGDTAGGREKPYQEYAQLSGKGEASPFWIKIYAPFSDAKMEPFEVPMRKVKDDKAVTVLQLLGLALWRYQEQELKPALAGDEQNINHWTLRIVEDEEVDFDFPALGRLRPLTDFTSNNNRPPQRRARDKPWDEFALVKATPAQLKDNEALTPQNAVDSNTAINSALPTPRLEATKPTTPQLSRVASETPNAVPQASFRPAHNPITGPSFAPSMARKDTATIQDLPQREIRQGAPRVGAPKTVIVHHTDPQSFATRVNHIETTADSYIAEIFDQCCKKMNLDKALHVFKVHGTQTVAPSDRTVEALGDRLHLDLVRRRFVGGGEGLFGLGLSGSPGSTSPNAPLDLAPANATPTQGKKKGMKGFGIHAPSAQAETKIHATTATLLNITGPAGTGGEGKRYHVLRKQPLSFAATHPRILIITPEYMTIMPAAPDSLAAPVGKVTNVPMTSIVGAKVSRKHPKMIRILVYREKETKRYDFEANNHKEAEAVVADVRRGMAAFGPSIDDGFV